jgi:hypothetical protein
MTKCSASHVLIHTVDNFILISHFTKITRYLDPHDPSVGLVNGDLVIPGNLLRREVFDPVVDQVGGVTMLQSVSDKIIRCWP